MRHILSCYAATVLLLCAAIPAEAQAPRPGRPYRGLFASGPADATHQLSVSGALGAGWDTDLLADARGGTRGGSSNWSGGLGNVSAGLAYALQNDALTLQASLGSTARYYPSFTPSVLHGTSGSVRLSAPLSTRASASAGVGVSHQPYTFLSLYPDSIDSPVMEPDIPDLDTSVSTNPYTSYQANAGMSYKLSNRTSLTGGLDYRAVARANASGARFTQYGAGARLTHTVGRGLDVRLGYAYSIARYDADREVVRQVLDAGVDYNRALSISRRTTLSFTTGTTMVRTGERQRFRLTGGARLTHEIGRSWIAYGGYGRQVNVHESWSEPLMSDAVTAGLGGLLTRRLQFSVQARGALGRVGAEQNAPGFDSVTTRAALSLALTRFMSMGVTYAYYHHQFDEEAGLPLFVRRSLDRQSIRASVNLWAPLVTMTRRSNASR